MSKQSGPRKLGDKKLGPVAEKDLAKVPGAILRRAFTVEIYGQPTRSDKNVTVDTYGQPTRSDKNVLLWIHMDSRQDQIRMCYCGNKWTADKFR